MQIVKPEIKDIEELLALWEEQYEYHHQLDPEYYVANSPELKAKFKTYLREAIANDKPLILIYKVEGEIAGFATFGIDQEDYFDTKIKRYGSVIELFVRSNHRQHGVGRKLMEKVEEYFRQRGIAWIELQDSAQNELAENFYEKNGYMVRQKLFFKNIRYNE